MNRRHLLSTSGALALAGCATTPTTGPTPAPMTPLQTAQSYAQAIETGLASALTVISASPATFKMTAAQVATLQGYQTQVQAGVTTILAAASTAAASPALAQVEAAGNAAIAFAATLPLPPNVVLIFTALSVALPLLEASLNNLPAAPIGARAKMSPKQAVAVLNAGA
jgi:hypothetical protein